MHASGWRWEPIVHRECGSISGCVWWGGDVVSDEHGRVHPRPDSEGKLQSVNRLCPVLPAHLSSPASPLPARSVPALKALFVARPHRPIYSFLWLARVPATRVCRETSGSGWVARGAGFHRRACTDLPGSPGVGTRRSCGAPGIGVHLAITKGQEQLYSFLGGHSPGTPFHLRAGGVGKRVLGLHGLPSCCRGPGAGAGAKGRAARAGGDAVLLLLAGREGRARKNRPCVLSGACPPSPGCCQAWTCPCRPLLLLSRPHAGQGQESRAPHPASIGGEPSAVPIGL